MKQPTGTQYVIGGRYNQYYVDRYIDGEMHGTVIGGTTKKRATEAANALNSAYKYGLQDAASFIAEQYKSDNPPKSCTHSIFGDFQCEGTINPLNGTCSEEFTHKSENI